MLRTTTCEAPFIEFSEADWLIVTVIDIIVFSVVYMIVVMILIIMNIIIESAAAGRITAWHFAGARVQNAICATAGA